jgi:hypothetical protein
MSKYRLRITWSTRFSVFVSDNEFDKEKENWLIKIYDPLQTLRRLLKSMLYYFSALTITFSAILRRKKIDSEWISGEQ